MSNHPQQVYQQALAAMRANQPDTTITLLKGLVKTGAVNEAVYNLLGHAQLRAGKEKDLQKTFKLWQKLNAKAPGIASLKAQVHRRHQRFDMAAEEYTKAFKLNSSDPQPLLDACLMYQEIEDWPKAEGFIDRYAAKGGVPLEAHTRKAVCRYSLHDFEAAQSYIDKAKAIGGEHDVLHYYQAMIDDKTGNKTEAEATFLDLIAKGHESSKFSLSLLYFTLGEWQKAFDLYEARPIARGFKQECAALGQTYWNGESLAGKKVYLRKEQGFGDQMQYQFFLPFLLEEGAEVTFYVDARLHPLVKENFPSVRCVGTDAQAEKLLKSEKFDYCLTIGSLGRIYAHHLVERSEKGFLPGEEGAFLNPSSDLKAEYQHYLEGRVESQDKPVIGLCWRSVKYMPGRDDWYLSAEQMAQVVSGLDAHFVSLQHDVVDEEKEAFKKAGIDVIYADDINLKDEQHKVLALISCLDKVVTVTTAMCQLAGANNVVTHCLSVKDIRWAVSEPHMRGFYPSVKLYYKSVFDAWDDVIGQVNGVLLEQQ